jgi:hypothetical protein
MAFNLCNFVRFYYCTESYGLVFLKNEEELWFISIFGEFIGVLVRVYEFDICEIIEFVFEEVAWVYYGVISVLFLGY